MNKCIIRLVLTGLAILFLLNSCSKGNLLELHSSAFKNGERIPDIYCHGYDEGKENISIPLNWVNPPVNTKSFALVFRHDTARVFILWAVLNIPSNCSEIPSGASGINMPIGSIELNNQSRKQGYEGPEPIRGSGEQRYVATLYALNTANINDVSGFKTYEEINAILKGKIIAKAEITGIYSSLQANHTAGIYQWGFLMN